MALVNRYDHEFPKRFLDEMLQYLSINEQQFPVACKMFEDPHMDLEYFDLLTNRFRSPHIWKYEDGGWILRNKLIPG